MKTFLTSVISLLIAFTLPAKEKTIDNQSLGLTKEERASIAAGLDLKLKYFKGTPNEKIQLLYDLFDLSDRHRQREIVDTLYNVAIDAENYQVALDAIRLNANLSLKNRDKLKELLKQAQSLPNSADRSETVAFVNIFLARNSNNSINDSARIAKISKAINNFNYRGALNKYNEIQILNEIAIYLSNSATPEHINEYLNRALVLSDSIESSSEALRNTTLTSLASLNLQTSNDSLIILYNNKLLQLVDRLEEKYKKEGRKYKQYNTVRFVALRRILTQYPSLSLATVDSIYHEIENINRLDSDVAKTNEKQPAAKAYWLMAHSRFAEALPLLEKSYEANNENNQRTHYLNRIITAATNSGNVNALLKYYPIYTELLYTALNLQSEAKYKELEMLYKTGRLKYENKQLRDNEEQEREAAHRIVTTVGATAIGILLLLVIILMIQSIRLRRIAKNFKETNEHLVAESQRLIDARQELIIAQEKARMADQHKSAFIDNMTREISNPLDSIAEYSQLIVDCVDDDKQPFLQRYADTIQSNVDLINTIINDILELGDIESSGLKLSKRPVAAKTIADTAIGAVEHKLKENVSLTHNLSDTFNPTISVDSSRVEQVLINLLGNAVKFTPKGSITIKFDLDKESDTASFTVTDTGIGIPEGKADTIFERFEKADPSYKGSGLGLTICNTIAQLMGGTITLDKSYHNGARFVFTFPAH